MQRAGAAQHHAAPVIIAADLGALAGRRHHLAVDLEAGLGHLLEVALQHRVLARRLGGDEAPAIAEVAGDLLLLDQLDDEVVRGNRLVRQHLGALRPELRHERAELGPQRAPDIAGIARARAVADLLGVEHEGVAPAARQRQRRREPDVARADDHDVGRGGQRRLGQHRARRRVPPIGRRLEVGRELNFAHRPVPGASMRPPAGRGKESALDRIPASDYIRRGGGCSSVG